MIFRYPGGKTRLLPILENVIGQVLADGDDFHDVFVGGGSVLVRVAQTHPKSRLFANDLDPLMYAFWKTVVGDPDDFDDLSARMRVVPTIDQFVELRSQTPETQVDKAYQAVFFNRTTFSGMRRSGPIGGYDTQGETKWKVSCRYNPNRLVNELRQLRILLLGRLSVFCEDGSVYTRHTRDYMYLDPPYYAQGKALYPVAMTDEDHTALAAALRHHGRWLLSYDDAPTVRQLYDWAAIAKIPARYSITGSKKEWRGAEELLISPRPYVTPWEERPWQAGLPSGDVN